ncbi:MAG: tyrosine-protein kinase Etk/Wzc [Maribacter sp.]
METQNISTSTKQDTVKVDFQKLLYRILSAWWLFLLCAIIAQGAAYMYLRYATFEYTSNAIILVKDAGSSGNVSTQSILLSDYGLESSKALDNEIQIIKSLTIMEKVVDSLKLNISYFRQGKFKETELYTSTPFVLDSFELAPNNIYGAAFFIELDNYETFVLKKNEEDEEGVTYKFGEKFTNGKGTFTISRNPVEAIVKGLHRIKIGTIQNTAYSYKGKLNIERIGDQRTSSVLSLSIIHTVPQKTADIINTLIGIYSAEEVKDENTVLRNTLVFIDNRVRELVKELDAVEGNIQDYKSDNEIIGDDASGSMNYTINEIRTAIKQISDYEIQKNLLASLEIFFVQNNETYDLVPSNLSVESALLEGFVSQYNNLIYQYKQLAVTATDKNPSLIAIKLQIKDSQDLILATIRNLKRDLAIPMIEIEKNIEELKRGMSSVPRIEKRLVEKKRIQAVKEQLFLYLLQKKEETALSEAVATAKTRIIDRARTPLFPIYPKKKLIQTTSGLLGVIFPAILLLIIGLFQNKIDSEETIKELTNIPILGKIPFKKGKANIVAKHGSRSAINEMFRLLRTNLNFINHNKEQQVILITSSISGEGKTFVAINLGITLALSNKKVILLGMDLRKPKMATYLGEKPTVGITNYLVGQKSIKEIIQQSKEHSNISYISSGPIPPNPAELIMSLKMEYLIKELSKEYDYIIIDAPPIGLVSDALLLRKLVDNMLIVIHHNMTRKVMVTHLDNMYKKNELPRASLVFNGVKQGRKYGYGGYYYGKNQSYYIEDD